MGLAVHCVVRADVMHRAMVRQDMVLDLVVDRGRRGRGSDEASDRQKKRQHCEQGFALGGHGGLRGEEALLGTGS